MICSWKMANSFESIWICLDEVLFGVEGWRFDGLKVLFDCPTFFCGFLLLHQLLLQRLTAHLRSTMPSLAHDGSPRIASPGVSAMYYLVCRQFATFCPLEVQSIVVSSIPNWGILDPL